MKRKKGQKIFDLPERGFEPQIFSNFPAHDWIFMEGEGDEIKSKQASKRDRTLPLSKLSTYLLYSSDGFQQMPPKIQL